MQLITQLLYPGIASLGLVVSIISVFKKSPFFNFLGLLGVIYGGLKSAALVMDPLPGQVIDMFMATSVFALLVYFSIQDQTLKAFLEPLRTMLVEDDKRAARIIVFILIPLLAGYIAYERVNPSFEPPVSGRIIHPEPPAEIDLKGQSVKILGLEDPLRKEAAKFPEHVESGKEIYYQNCFFCHGADLDGRGNFALAFNPPPPPFIGTDTIAQLPESYVFWRIVKGWKDLPAGSNPWDSAMPAFEDLLPAGGIWKSSLFIYDYSGNRPRTWE